MSTARENWYARPCGGRDVLRLAMPLILSTGSWSLLHFVDRLFLLWYSDAALAASMPAGMLYWTMICFPVGVASYANTFVAQYHGARQPRRIGLVIGQGLWFGVCVTPIFLAVAPLAPFVFRWVGHGPELVPLEATYFEVLSFGAGAAVLSAVQSAFFTGRGLTRVVMIVDIGATALNAALDYAWIFGHWGLPAAGIAGAAWATVVAQWVKVVVYWFLMRTRSNRETFGCDGLGRLDRDLLTRLLRFGGQNGLQLLVEGAAFTVFVLLVGRLGKTATAATTLAFSVNNVAFVPMIGLSIAVSTLVGQQLGNNRPDLAERATWTSLWISLAYTSVFAIAYILLPDVFLWAHARGAVVEDFVAIRRLTVVLLRFVAAYCLFDAMQLVFVGAIKGAGDTWFILLASLLTGGVALAIGQAGAVWAGGGLIWWWTICTLWICVLGMAYFMRFRQGHWKRLRVIEPDLPPATADEVSATDSSVAVHR